MHGLWQDRLFYTRPTDQIFNNPSTNVSRHIFGLNDPFWKMSQNEHVTSLIVDDIYLKLQKNKYIQVVPNIVKTTKYCKDQIL